MSANSGSIRAYLSMVGGNRPPGRPWSPPHIAGVFHRDRKHPVDQRIRPVRHGFRLRHHAVAIAGLRLSSPRSNASPRSRPACSGAYTAGFLGGHGAFGAGDSRLAAWATYALIFAGQMDGITSRQDHSGRSAVLAADGDRGHCELRRQQVYGGRRAGGAWPLPSRPWRPCMFAWLT